jgi:hypothetical protein
MILARRTRRARRIVFAKVRSLTSLFSLISDPPRRRRRRRRPRPFLGCPLQANASPICLFHSTSSIAKHRSQARTKDDDEDDEDDEEEEEEEEEEEGEGEGDDAASQRPIGRGIV